MRPNRAKMVSDLPFTATVPSLVGTTSCTTARNTDGRTPNHSAPAPERESDCDNIAPNHMERNKVRIAAALRKTHGEATTYNRANPPNRTKAGHRRRLIWYCHRAILTSADVATPDERPENARHADGQR